MMTIQVPDPTRIRLGLAYRRLTLAWLSERLGRRLDDTTLADLDGKTTEHVARLLNFPPSFFEYRPGLSASPIEHSGDEHAWTRAECMMLADTTDILQAMVRIPDRMAGLRERFDTPIRDAAWTAMRIRETIGAERLGPIRNMTRLAERLGVTVAPVHGLTRPAVRTAPPLIIVGDHWDGGRLRLGVAEGLIRMLTTPDAHPKDWLRSAAVLLLLPSDDLRRIVEPNMGFDRWSMLKAGWGVNLRDILSTARMLDLIDATEHERLLRRLRRETERHGGVEPVRVGGEYPLLLLQMTGRVFDGLESASSAHADRTRIETELGMPAGLVRSWCANRLTVR